MKEDKKEGSRNDENLEKTDGTKKKKETGNSKTDAKKKVSRVTKRKISPDLIPINEETWLIQPLSVTMMRHDFTQIQNKVLTTIIAHMQDKIHEKLNNDNLPSLFTDEELGDDGRLPIKIQYKSLGVQSKHYDQLEEALKMISHIPIEFPVKGKDGRGWVRSTNLCDVYIQENVKYNKYAIVKMDIDIAERLVSMDLGYHRLGKEIMFNARNRYTQRIYMMLEAWISKGWFKVKTSEFRRTLRLEDKYPIFSDFEKRVLKPAQEELKDMADAEVSDCWFEYEKLYSTEQAKTKEDPEHIYFKIHVVKTAGDENDKAILEANREQFKKLLIRHVHITPANAEKLSMHIKTKEDYQPVMDKLMKLMDYIKEHPVKNAPLYVCRSFDNFFAEREGKKNVETATDSSSDASTQE
jgi:hypothetical protein